MNWHLFNLGLAALVNGTFVLAFLLAIPPMPSPKRWASRVAWLAGLIVMSCWPLALNVLAAVCLDPSLKTGAHYGDGIPVPVESMERFCRTGALIWAIVIWIRYWPWSARAHRKKAGTGG
jgi:hypothetical protein